MPKREPKRKIKNIIQSVVVNVGDIKKVSKRKRAPRRRPKKEEVDIMARVAPSIVYVPSPSVNVPVPAAFTPQPPPVPFSAPVARTFTETIEVPKSQPIDLPVKSETLDMLGDVVTQSEFIPTANFISETEKIKGQTTQDSIYTVDPLPITEVAGNYKFGELETAPSMMKDNTKMITSDANTKKRNPPSDKLINLYMKRVGGGYGEARNAIDERYDMGEKYNQVEKYIKSLGAEKEFKMKSIGLLSSSKSKRKSNAKSKRIVIDEEDQIETMSSPIRENFIFNTAY
jgi:hypothetical protein